MASNYSADNHSIFTNVTDDVGDDGMPETTAVGAALYDFRNSYLVVHGYLSIVVCVFGMITNVSANASYCRSVLMCLCLSLRGRSVSTSSCSPGNVYGYWRRVAVT